MRALIALMLVFYAAASASAPKYTDQRQYVLDMTSSNCAKIREIEKPVTAADYETNEAYGELSKKRTLKDITCTCLPAQIERFKGIPAGKSEQGKALFNDVWLECTVKALREVPYCVADSKALKVPNPEAACGCLRKSMSAISEQRLNALLTQGLQQTPQGKTARAGLEKVLSDAYSGCGVRMGVPKR